MRPSRRGQKRHSRFSFDLIHLASLGCLRGQEKRTKSMKFEHEQGECDKQMSQDISQLPGYTKSPHRTLIQKKKNAFRQQDHQNVLLNQVESFIIHKYLYDQLLHLPQQIRRGLRASHHSLVGHTALSHLCTLCLARHHTRSRSL